MAQRLRVVPAFSEDRCPIPRSQIGWFLMAETWVAWVYEPQLGSVTEWRKGRQGHKQMYSKVGIQWCLLIPQSRASDLPMTLVEASSSFRGHIGGPGPPREAPAHRLPSHLQYPPTAHICLHSFSTYPAYPQLPLLSQHILTHNSGENLLLHQRPCPLPEPLLWWRTTCWTKGHAPTFRTLTSNLDRNILLDQRLPQTSEVQSPTQMETLFWTTDYPGQKTKEKTEKKGTKHASNKDKKRNQHLDL